MKRILAGVTATLVILGWGIGGDGPSTAGDDPVAAQRAQADSLAPLDQQAPELPRALDADQRGTPPPVPQPPRQPGSGLNEPVAPAAQAPEYQAVETGTLPIDGARTSIDPQGHLHVDAVAGNSPAAQFGLMPGDRIVAVDGQPVRTRGLLDAYLRRNVDRPVPITVLRDGQESTVYTTPGPTAATPLPATAPPRRAATTAGPRPALGVSFVQGPRLRIRDIVPGSAADRAGLRRGDTIVSLDGERFPSTDRFLDAVAAADFNREPEIVFVREGQRHVNRIQVDEWDRVYPEAQTVTALRPVVDEAGSASVLPAAGCCAGAGYPRFYGSTYGGPWFYAPYWGPIYYGPWPIHGGACCGGWGPWASSWPYYAPWWPYHSAAYGSPAYVGWQWW